VYEVLNNIYIPFHVTAYILQKYDNVCAILQSIL